MLLLFTALFVHFDNVVGSDTALVINEVNLNYPALFNRHEYIELRNIRFRSGEQITLGQYLLIIINGYDEEYKGPAIVFSADMWDSGKLRKEFFTIGAQEVGADLPFTHKQVMYAYKHYHEGSSSQEGTSASSEKQKLKQIYLLSFIRKRPRTSDETPDPEPNPDTEINPYPLAIVLLYQEYRREATDEESPGMSKLRLVETGHKRKSKSKMKLTPDHVQIIVKYRADVVLYSHSPICSSCDIFENLFPAPAANSRTLMPKQAQEWDIVGKRDHSVNRCPISNAELKLPFLYTRFKLGRCTPNEPNDCTGSRYIINAIENIPYVFEKTMMTQILWIGWLQM